MNLLNILNVLVIIFINFPKIESTFQLHEPDGEDGPDGIAPCETLCGPPYNLVCAYDCSNKCFQTHRNTCELSGYNRCRKPPRGEHTYIHDGPCNPKLPPCNYSCKQTWDYVCIFDLRYNCFRTVWDECSWVSYNCNRYYTVFISYGECSGKQCKLCDNECYVY